MTRILAEMIGAPERALKNDIKKLETVSGHPNADIHLTVEVLHAVKLKLKELGLDPQDTNGPELYRALHERLKQDDARLVQTLQAAGSDPDDVLSGVAHALQTLPLAGSCFALKTTVAKRFLKKTTPKKAMKLLGYRSFDSMLKHEPVAAVYAVACSVESEAWRRALIEQYTKLTAADFETRAITVIHPKSAKWLQLSAQLVAQHKHSVLKFKELGAVVMLPLPPADQPPAFTTTTLILALQAMNEVRSTSSFLRLHQLHPHFGKMVFKAVTDELTLTNDSLDRPLAWRVIQRFYTRFKQAFDPEAFELAIQRHDLSWHSIERALENLEPSLGFWRGTEHLSLLHDREPVSFNLIDVALSYCNNLPFQSRIVHHVREALSQELAMRYLQPENVEQLIRSQLQPELVQETA